MIFVTLVERKSRFTLLKKIHRCAAEANSNAFVLMLKPYRPRALTIICDNGRELAGHKEIAEEMDADVYFAHPYASWDRGTNENTNGLLRQYFPKGSDFSKITDEEAGFAENCFNTRPRKSLNVKTPKMVFFKLSDVVLTPKICNAT